MASCSNSTRLSTQTNYPPAVLDLLRELDSPSFKTADRKTQQAMFGTLLRSNSIDLNQLQANLSQAVKLPDFTAELEELIKIEPEIEGTVRIVQNLVQNLLQNNQSRLHQEIPAYEIVDTKKANEKIIKNRNITYSSKDIDVAPFKCTALFITTVDQNTINTLMSARSTKFINSKALNIVFKNNLQVGLVTIEKLVPNQGKVLVNGGNMKRFFRKEINHLAAQKGIKIDSAALDRRTREEATRILGVSQTSGTFGEVGDGLNLLTDEFINKVTV